MQCPQCGTRNPLGSSHCSSCGMPFTRQASQQANGHPAVPSQQVRRPAPAAPRKRKRGGGCLVPLLVMLALVAGILIGTFVVADLVVKPRVADVVATNIRTSIEDSVRDRIQAELGDLESGTLTISEAEINQRLHEGRDMGPVDEFDVNIRPEGISAEMSAYGLSGDYSADVVVEDGQIRLVNGSVGGPLQYVVDHAEVERVAAETINQVLNESGYEITSIRLEEGELVLELGASAS